MRVCIVGNSQAGALKEAVAEAMSGRLKGYRFETYAVAGGRGPHLGVRDGRIHPVKNAKRLFTDIPGAAEQGLDLAPYDAVLYSAAGLPAQRTAFDFHVLNRIADAAFCHQPTAERRLVSHAVFAASVKSHLLASDTLRALDVIRSVFAGPLFVQSWPLPSPAILERQDCDLGTLYGARLGDFLSAYYRIQLACIEEVCAGIGAVFLPLPVEEALETGFTPREYGGPEAWHMNAAYGARVLDSLAARAAA